jgi:hypothetical protein
MQGLTARERGYTGRARGMRAAIVLPPLFALALLVIKRTEMPGFPVFGPISVFLIESIVSCSTMLTPVMSFSGPSSTPVAGPQPS